MGKEVVRVIVTKCSGKKEKYLKREKMRETLIYLNVNDRNSREKVEFNFLESSKIPFAGNKSMR